MRIGIDAVALQNAHCQAGLYQYTHRLVRGLDAVDKENDFSLVFFNWRNHAMEKVINHYQVGAHVRKDCCRVPFRVLEGLAALSVPVGRFVGDFDVFHGPSFRLPPGRYAKRLVVTVHDLKFLSPGEFFSSDHAGAAMFRRHTVDAVKRADVIVAVSRFTQTEIAERLKCSPDRIRVIYPGIGEEFRSNHAPLTIRHVCEQYGVTSPYVLFVGLQEEKKNLLRLVEAFARIQSQLPQRHQLVLAGPAGPMTLRLRSLISELGIERDVRLPGQIAANDLPMLYAGARLFVFPSLHEGFGIPPLEAMASGVPVVASNAAALPEIVGPAAMLIDPTQTEEIAESMRAVLTEEGRWADMRDRGLCHAQRFCWRKMAQETVALYKELS